MASYIGEVINLLSEDDSKVKVEQIISSPEKKPPPHRKKRLPFSSCAKQEPMTSRRKRKIPDHACGGFFTRRTLKSHIYFLHTRKRLRLREVTDDVDLSRSPLKWESIPENPFSSLLSFLVRIHSR
jgi:hypothetical protein